MTPSFRSAAVAAGVLTLVAISGCSRPEAARVPSSVPASAQQAIVDHSAEAFSRLRAGDPSKIDNFLARARGVMIFPRVVKASVILGGEGGNGVLVARAADGSWSDPAFYSLGAPSVGLQIGFQEATVVLFFMEDAVLEQALHADVTLGTNTGVALGDAATNQSDSEVLSKPIYQLVEARGAFVGASLDGYVISARNKHNQAYYGAPVTPRDILIERTQHRPAADVLLRALASHAGGAISVNP
jgi:lipid-binding SYLF domain-containing protein